MDYQKYAFELLANVGCISEKCTSPPLLTIFLRISRIFAV